MNCLIRAASAGEAFYARIRHGSFQGKVHSVFRRVINLICRDGVLYTIGFPSVGNSPNGLLVNVDREADFHSLSICQEDTFNTIGCNTLLVGSVVFDLSDITIWSPIEPEQRVSIPVMLENGQILKTLAGSAWAPEAIGRLLSDQSVDQIAVAQLRQNILALKHSVRTHNYQAIGQAAAGIVGFGPGLTPSGDDLLTGFMLGIYWSRKAQGLDAGEFEQCNQQIVATAKSRTHLISYTQLLFAARGLANEPVHALLMALFYQAGRELPAAASRVLDLGSTSGSDIISGIIIALDFVLPE